MIWAGAVYSYGDLAAYGISDSSFVRAPDGANESPGGGAGASREAYGEPGSDHPYWQAVSLSGNIRYLQNHCNCITPPNDSVVASPTHSDLSGVLQANNKVYEYYEYEGGEHNIESPYFETRRCCAPSSSFKSTVTPAKAAKASTGARAAFRLFVAVLGYRRVSRPSNASAPTSAGTGNLTGARSRCER